MSEDAVEAINHEKLAEMAVTFTGEFSTTETLQNPKETEWIQSLRQSKSIHDPEVEVKFDKNDSRIYSGFTSSKEVPLVAKLKQHLIREKERNFAITATPKPRVKDEELQGIVSPLIMTDETGASVFPDETAINSAIFKFTQEHAESMTLAVDDQLVESQYNFDQESAIESGVRYGTGIIKGPLTESYEEVETVFQAPGAVIKTLDFMKRFVARALQLDVNQNPIGAWTQRTVTKYRPDTIVVPIWRFYPDQSTVELAKCAFVYELHSMTRHEMNELSKRQDFFGDVINAILEKHSEGNYKLRSWETQLQSMPENQQSTIDVKSFEVVERNGYISHDDLVGAGIIVDEDDEKEHFCNFWICAGKCIKISVWPKSVFKSPVELYHLFYYKKDETSIHGTGLPRVLRDRQLAINAGERHLIGHVAWLVKPCGEVNLANLDPLSAKHAENFGAGSFLAQYAPGNNPSKILNLYFMQNNVASIVAVLNFMREQGDQESSLPSSLFGAPSLRDTTAKSDAIRFENLLDFIKDLARNFDKMNTSVIRAHVRWNNEFNPDPAIRGDLEVKAVGSVQALIENAIMDNMSFFFQSAPDWLQEYLKKAEAAKLFMKVMFKAHDLTYTEEEVAKNNAPMQQKQAEIDALQTELAQIKGKKDLAQGDKVAAQAEKIRAEIPFAAEKAAKDIERAQIENIAGQVDVAKSLTGEAPRGKT